MYTYCTYLHIPVYVDFMANFDYDYIIAHSIVFSYLNQKISLHIFINTLLRIRTRKKWENKINQQKEKMLLLLILRKCTRASYPIQLLGIEILDDGIAQRSCGGGVLAGHQSAFIMIVGSIMYISERNIGKCKWQRYRRFQCAASMDPLWYIQLLGR